MSRNIRQRHKHSQSPDNLDRWMVSYADFITLLFAFFVVMYAISAVNVDKYKMFSVSLVSAFGGRNDPNANKSSNDPEAQMKLLVDRRNARLGEQLRKQQEYMQTVAKNLSQVMAPLVTSGQVSVTQTSRGVVLDISASVLFNQGEADLQRSSVKLLSDVARILEQGEQAIEVEGHSDNVPIKTPIFPSNWELSSARASSVARLFIENGITEQRLTVVGSAANNPVASNDTIDGRARNRRVTVTLLSPSAERQSRQTVQ